MTAGDWLTLAAVVVPTLAVVVTAILHHKSIARLDAKNETVPHDGMKHTEPPSTRTTPPWKP